MAATKALELAQIANTLDVSANGEITNIGTLSSIEATGNATFGAVLTDSVTISNANNSTLQLVSTETTATSNTVIGDIQFYGSDASLPGAGVKSRIKVTATGLYRDGSSIYMTTSDGITNDVTRFAVEYNGDVKFYDNQGVNAKLIWDASTPSLDFPDGSYATFGNSSDLQIYHTGSSSNIRENGTGNLAIWGDNIYFYNSAGTEVKAGFDTDGAVTLRYDGSQKLATTSTGIDVTGTITTDDLVVSGNLTVSGTMTSINSDNLEIEDLNITLANGAADSTAANGAGLTVEGANAQFTYDSTQNRWNMNKGLELIGTPLVVGTGTTDVGRVENSAGVFSLYAYTGRQIAFGNDTNGEHVRIAADGKVGIGTDSPTTYLDVKGSDNSQARLEGTDTNPTTLMMDYNSTGSTDRVRIQNDAGDLKFTTSNGQVRQTLLKTGNVGIGTESPSAKLHTAINDSTEYSTTEASELNAVGTDALYLHNEENTSTNGKVSIAFRSNGGGGAAGGRITLKNNRSGSGAFAWFLRDNGHTTDQREKMILTSDGELGINQSSPASTLDVGGAITLSGDTEHQIVKKTTSAITGGTTDVTEIKGRQIDLYSYDDIWLRAGTADDIGFVAGGSTRLTVLSTGHVVPGADNTQNLGSASARWANIYTGDLHLSNEGSQNEVDGTSGNWTIQEGEEHLYIINNKSGKKYKFALEEIE